MPSTPGPAPAKRGVAGLYSVIGIKLGKALLLLGLAAGIFSLLGDDLRVESDRLARWLRQDPEDQFWLALADKLRAVTPAGIRWLASGTLMYSGLLFVESVGLVLRAGWAAWLAIGETAFFIPVEVVELVRQFRLGVLALLVVNLLIVVYLARNRDRLFRHH